MDPNGLKINGWKCMTIPALDSVEEKDRKRRFLFTSENEILHVAGNSLQISTILESDTVEKINEIPQLDELNDAGRAKIDPRQSNILTIAEQGRGFSCFAYNSFRNHVPSLLVVHPPR